jgi:hypothetical protein
VLEKAGEPIDGFRALFLMNQENGGFDCPGCAWPDDPNGLRLDICENGIKHVTWELTRKQVDRAFFAGHSVSELAGWERLRPRGPGTLGRAADLRRGERPYVPISWEEAFRVVGDVLRGLDSPYQGAFYTSGRLSNEATFLCQLWVRELGTNNLPGCSNMCHEASGRALTAAIGSGKGTVDVTDWEQADQNRKRQPRHPPTVLAQLTTARGRQRPRRHDQPSRNPGPPPVGLQTHPTEAIASRGFQKRGRIGQSLRWARAGVAWARRLRPSPAGPSRGSGGRGRRGRARDRR